MVHTLDCGIVVREFEHQSRYYIYFQTNTLGNGMDLFVFLSRNSTTTVLKKKIDGFGIK